jgi:hypothetical protein
LLAAFFWFFLVLLWGFCVLLKYGLPMRKLFFFSEARFDFFYGAQAPAGLEAKRRGLRGPGAEEQKSLVRWDGVSVLAFMLR